MIYKLHAFIEIKLNDKFIGFATISYFHSNENQKNSILTSLMLNPGEKNDPKIQLTNQWSDLLIENIDEKKLIKNKN